MKKIGEIQINPVGQTGLEPCSKHITQITNLLTEMAALCILRGQFKSGEEKIIINDLMRDIRSLNLPSVFAAIRIHKQKSPFMPHLSDLIEILKPLREYEAAREHKNFRKMTDIRLKAEVNGNNIVNEKKTSEIEMLALAQQNRPGIAPPNESEDA